MGNFASVPSNGEKIEIKAVLSEIGPISKNINGKVAQKCKLKDASGVTKTVTIYAGNSGPLQPELLGSTCVFMVKRFDGKYGPIYQGFCNGVADEPIKPAQTENGGCDCQASAAAASDDVLRTRSMALKYANDLAVAGVLEPNMVIDVAIVYTQYILNGSVAEKPAQVEQEEVEEEEIPF